jgi:hypothetical protein
MAGLFQTQLVLSRCSVAESSEAQGRSPSPHGAAFTEALGCVVSITVAQSTADTTRIIMNRLLNVAHTVHGS